MLGKVVEDIFSIEFLIIGVVNNVNGNFLVLDVFDVFFSKLFDFNMLLESNFLKGIKKVLGNGMKFGFIFFVENEDVVDFGVEVILDVKIVFCNFMFMFFLLLRDCLVVSF